MRICVFGAGGATGNELISQALERDWQVVASARARPPSLPVDARIVFREADVLGGDVARCVAGCDAVCSALGVGNDALTLADPPPIYTVGTRSILRAMRAEGLTRLVAISAAFVADRSSGPAYFRIPAMAALRKVFDRMAEMEAILRDAEGIEWTAVRPGWLMAGERTGDARVVADTLPEGTIRTRRADLAALMLDCIEHRDWIGQTPAIARTEDPSMTSPAAVARQFME